MTPGHQEGHAASCIRSYRLAAEIVVSALGVGAVWVAAWPIIIGLGVPGPPLLAPMIAHVAGMLAGYGVLVLLVVMSRWPALERGVGADRLARWHARGGRGVFTLVIVHAVAAVSAWAQATGLSSTAALVDVVAMPGLLTATIGTALMIVIIVISIRAVRRRLPYETWHGLHLFMYVAVALSFLHQLAGPDLAGRPVLQVLWALLYTHAFGLVLRYRLIEPARADRRHRLRVVAVVPEVPGVVSIVLEGRHLDELDAAAGHFFRWRFLTRHLWASAYPFSLSAPPSQHQLRLTVKALGDGSRRVQQVSVGTRVAAEGPYGAMTVERRTHRDVLLVAGGVGITPLRALFEVLPTGPDHHLMLLYRARTREDVVFRRELDALAAARRAHVVYLLGDNPHLLSSRTISRLVPDVATRDVYLCGPPRMAAAVRASLAQCGLPPTHLHEERFSF